MKVQRMMVIFGVFWLGLALGQPVVGLARTLGDDDIVTVTYRIRAKVGFNQETEYTVLQKRMRSSETHKSQQIRNFDYMQVSPIIVRLPGQKISDVTWLYDSTHMPSFAVNVRYVNDEKTVSNESFQVTAGAEVSLHVPNGYHLKNKKEQVLRVETQKEWNLEVPVIGNNSGDEFKNLGMVEVPDNKQPGTGTGQSQKPKPENPETGKSETQTPEPDQSVIVEPEATVKPNHSNTGENETAKPDNSNQSSSDGTKPTGNQPTGTVNKESHGQATATGKQPAGQPEKPKPEEPAQVTPLPAPSITNGGALDKGTPSNKQPQQPTKKPTEGTKPGESSHRPVPVAQQPPVVNRPLVETNSTVAPLPVTAEPEKPIVTVPHVPVRLPHTSPLAHQEAPLLPDNVPAKEPARKPQRPQLRRRTPDKTSAANLTGEMPARPSLPHTSHSRLPQTNEATNPFHWGGLVLLVTLMGSALTRRIRR